MIASAVTLTLLGKWLASCIILAVLALVAGAWLHGVADEIEDALDD